MLDCIFVSEFYLIWIGSIKTSHRSTIEFNQSKHSEILCHIYGKNKTCTQLSDNDLRIYTKIFCPQQLLVMLFF